MRTNHQSKRELDKIDRNILRILQADARISFTELGEKVGLSTTPCTERVRRLEREGIIMSYNARLNPQHLKGSLLVFVEISLDYKSGDTFEEFRRAVLKLPHVLECHLVSGDFDYLVKARISEMASYRKLLGDILLKLPHVRESKSYIVMEEVKESLNPASRLPRAGAYPKDARPVPAGCWQCSREPASRSADGSSPPVVGHSGMAGSAWCRTAGRSTGARHTPCSRSAPGAHN